MTLTPVSEVLTLRQLVLASGTFDNSYQTDTVVDTIDSLIMVAELVSSLGISEVFYQYLSDPRTYLKSLEVRPILKREVVSRIDKLIRYLETGQHFKTSIKVMTPISSDGLFQDDFKGDLQRCLTAWHKTKDSYLGNSTDFWRSFING